MKSNKKKIEQCKESMPINERLTAIQWLKKDHALALQERF